MASFFLFFYLGFFGLFYLFIFIRSLIPTYGGIIVSIILSSLGNALIMMIITLLFTYNSKITTQYLEQNMTLCECLRRCTGICNESRVTCIKNDERWLCHKYDVNYMIMQSNMTMMEHVIINGMVVSCMAIYLGMAMEMP